MNTTTPKGINRHVRALCARISPNGAPRYVDVRPRSDSGHGDCFNDVARQVQEHGGSVLHGWQIWEWPGVFAEAEFHAVWQRPDDELIDVQLKPDGESQILFLPQGHMHFTGERRGNIRHAIGDDPLIRTYINEENRFFKLFQNEFGNAIGEVRVQGELAVLRLKLNERMVELQRKFGR